MSKFYEDLGKAVVGNCYRSSVEEQIGKIKSVDVSVGEIHYDLFSEEGKLIRSHCSSIESFSHFNRVSEENVKK